MSFARSNLFDQFLADPFLESALGQEFSQSHPMHPTFMNRISVPSAPKVDMWEEADVIKILIDLPGMSREHVKIEVRDGKLLVWGECKDTIGQEKTLIRRERQVGQVRRSINLPFNADQSKVDAKFVDGVLHIDIKKMNGAENKLIQIK